PLRRDFALSPEAVITGRLVRASDGTPVAGSYVHVRTRDEHNDLRVVWTTSNERGQFRLTGVGSGRHRLGVFHDEVCARAVIEVNAGPGQSVEDLVVPMVDSLRLSG